MGKNSLVNRCVKEAFGKRFSGDWHFEGSHYTFFKYFRGNSPKMIAEPLPFYLDTSWLFFLAPAFLGTTFKDPLLAGYFENGDETQLRVKSTFMKQAEKYKEIYESKEESRKRVNIGLMPEDIARIR